MRVLRFRAWDHGTNKWHRFNNLEFIKEADFETITIKAIDGLCIFEQYTGLDDKNGKDIYEGDIVSTNTIWYSRISPITEVVEYQSDGKYAPFGSNDYAWDLSKTEIVGNIHENKDLL